MRALVNLLGVVALAYAAVLALVFVFQGKLLYLTDFGGREPTVTPAAVGLEFDELVLDTADGDAIHGWYVPRRGARLTLVYFHGNAGNIGHRIGSIRAWHEAGLAVLIFDYRGYGRSEGRPSEAATYADAEAVWDHLTRERGVRAADVVLYGRSLGAAIATWLAARHTPGALIVESGFTSIPDLAAEIYPWLPARLLARFSYDTEEAIGRLRCPVLIVHSPEDEIIPFHHGRALLAAAREPKAFLETGGGHNDAVLLSVPRYRERLRRFLDALTSQEGPERLADRSEFDV